MGDLKNNDLLKTKQLKSIDVNPKMKIPVDALEADAINIDLGTMILYDHWYKIANQLWYLKKIDDPFMIVNELLGSFLAEYMSLKTVSNFIATIDEKIVGVISPNFRQANVKYYERGQISWKIKCLNSLALFPSNRLVADSLCRELANYYVLVLFISLGDRPLNEIYQKDDIYSLGPICDYSLAFKFPTITSLANSLLFEDYSIANLQKYLKNTYIKDALEKLASLDIDMVLDYLSSLHGIDIPEEFYEYYNRFLNKRKRLILK